MKLHLTAKGVRLKQYSILFCFLLFACQNESPTKKLNVLADEMSAGEIGEALLNGDEMSSDTINAGEMMSGESFVDEEANALSCSNGLVSGPMLITEPTITLNELIAGDNDSEVIDQAPIKTIQKGLSMDIFAASQAINPFQRLKLKNFVKGLKTMRIYGAFMRSSLLFM